MWHACAECVGSRDEEVNILLATPTPESSDEYWSIVFDLVLKGQLVDASKLLLQHSALRTNPRVSTSHDYHTMSHDSHMQVFSSIEEVLLSAPMLTSTANLSRADLQRRWTDWRKEVSRRRDAGDYLPFQHLDLLARVRGGGRGCG